jgi:hypothetical protein
MSTPSPALLRADGGGGSLSHWRYPKSSRALLIFKYQRRLARLAVGDALAQVRYRRSPLAGAA